MSSIVITIDEAVAHLRLVGDAATPPSELADLQSKVDEATDVILDYLKLKADPEWEPTTAPRLVKAAVKHYLAYWYEHRGDDLSPNDTAEKVWGEIERILRRSRDPALA